MSQASSEFRAQRQERAYPAALLERYEIIECLSSSENGETLLVSSRESGEYRVAKIVESAECEAECVLLAKLTHPSLPTLCEQITDGDTHVLMRSFVAGKPLSTVVLERRMTESEIVSIGVQLCDALTYLHTRTPPVIHRDVKPQNVILGTDGKVTLIDFGIARTYKTGAPKDTVFSGTSDFAPPEQYGFAQTDARADIYALGMLLKFLLTNGETNGEIHSPRLRRIVRRCTAFAPGKRYGSAQAVKRALLRSDGKRARRAVAVAAALTALVCGVAIGRYAVPRVPPSAEAVAFAEPTVEQAARLALDKPTGSLTMKDLSKVYALHIVGSAAYADSEAFGQAYDAWCASPQLGSAVGLSTLSDLAMFPNLAWLEIVGGDYPNLDDLSCCRRLERLTLIANDRLSDIGGLYGLDQLHSVHLFDCGALSDLSPLASLPKLKELELIGDIPYNAAVLEKLGDLDMLLLSDNDAAYHYVHNKRIGRLRLSGAEMEDLSSLRTITGLTELQLCCPSLRSLEGIEVHEGIQKLDFWVLGAVDLSPLLALPNLTELILPADAQADVSALETKPGLTITYQ